MFARIVRPINALQLYRWQFSHRCTTIVVLVVALLLKGGSKGAMAPLKMLKSPFGLLHDWFTDCESPETNILCLKCTKIRLAAGLRPDPLGELKRSSDRPTRNRGVLLLRGRAFQLTRLMMAQPHWNTRPNGNVELPIVIHSFNGEQPQEILRHLSTQKGANLCIKCTKIRLPAGLRLDPLGKLKCSPDCPTRNRGVVLLRGETFQLTGLMTA